MAFQKSLLIDMKVDNKNKILIYVALAIGTGILIRYLVRKRKDDKISEVVTDPKKPSKESDNKVENKPTYTSESLKPKATISEATAKKYADTIYNALDGCTTDLSTVISTLKKLKNDADFNLLVKVYGTRTVRCWASGNCTGGLIQNLKSDMENLERYAVNQVLKDRGIKLQLPRYSSGQGWCT
jgi:hypothetical protein